MAMRYHWGLGIGHTYSHEGASYFQQPPIPPSPDESEDEGTEDVLSKNSGPDNQEADSDHAESESNSSESSNSDDEAFLELHDTYYSD